MAGVVIQASKAYRDKKAAVESELKAPRKLIGWVIGFQVIELIALGAISWKLFLG